MRVFRGNLRIADFQKRIMDLRDRIDLVDEFPMKMETYEKGASIISKGMFGIIGTSIAYFTQSNLMGVLSGFLEIPFGKYIEGGILPLIEKRKLGQLTYVYQLKHNTEGNTKLRPLY